MDKPLHWTAGGRASADSYEGLSDAELLRLEDNYCSHGDTVHYTDPPKLFTGCDGSYMFDAQGRAYLDLQMWYSAVNFGYRNERLNNAAKRQLDTLPQVASQYLHKEKIELAVRIARDAEKKFGEKGRVHFNVGGAQAVEDSLKLVRNFKKGKSLMFAFEGGYHGRTLGASAITSSYRYRRRFGHFGERAHFLPFPYVFRGPKGMTKEEYGEHCVAQFARLFESEYNGVWDPKVGEAEYAAFYVEPLQGTGGYIVPPPNFFKGLKKILDERGILLVVDEIQMGFYRTGKLWSIEHFGVTPDVIVFGKAITNGLNPLSGIWAREELINPTDVPAGLDALDLQRQSDGNRRRSRDVEDARGDRLRDDGDGEGRLPARGPEGPEAAPQDRRRRRRPRSRTQNGDLRAARQLDAVEGARRPHGRRGACRQHRDGWQEVRPRPRHRRLLQERRDAGAEPAHHPGGDGSRTEAARPAAHQRRTGLRDRTTAVSGGGRGRCFACRAGRRHRGDGQDRRSARVLEAL